MLNQNGYLEDAQCFALNGPHDLNKFHVKLLTDKVHKQEPQRKMSMFHTTISTYLQAAVAWQMPCYFTATFTYL